MKLEPLCTLAALTRVQHTVISRRSIKTVTHLQDKADFYIHDAYVLSQKFVSTLAHKRDSDHNMLIDFGIEMSVLCSVLVSLCSFDENWENSLFTKTNLLNIFHRFSVKYHNIAIKRPKRLYDVSSIILFIQQKMPPHLKNAAIGQNGMNVFFLTPISTVCFKAAPSVYSYKNCKNQN